MKCYVFLIVVFVAPALSEIRTSLLPGKSVINIIPELLGYSGTSPPVTRSLEATTVASYEAITEESTTDILLDQHEMGPDAPDPRYPVLHAGLPRELKVYPMPLQHSDHELQFNVTWQPSFGPPARDYSVEITSLTETIDCKSPMCYEYNIPGTDTWRVIPEFPNPIAETCAVRPGCAYRVRLIAHPWDGHTAANINVELDECVAGVCSCAHSPRLPSPVVEAHTVSILGEVYVNVTWVTPPPTHPLRLPPGLKKQKYVVSIGKQMVSNSHPAPWFANTVIRYVDADGLVIEADNPRWLLLPINESSNKRSDERRDKRLKPRLLLDVRLLARVNVIDERGCVGPAGNATAYDPVAPAHTSYGPYILWAALGGACIMAMCALIAVSARLVKRVLNAFRPAPVSAPLDAPRRRPAWFPLQLRTGGKRTDGSPDGK